MRVGDHLNKNSVILVLSGILILFTCWILNITYSLGIACTDAGAVENGMYIDYFHSSLINENKGGSLQLYAKNAVLIDGETGDVLYGKNQNEHRPNASTTKILTCILALECGDKRDLVTASSYASKQPEVKLGVRDGERYLLEDMIYAMMLESYNDAAVVIAEHIGGSVPAFAEMMNEKAREIGCKSTYFITPNGLDASDPIGVHGTSAEDLARIMRYCIIVSPMKDEFLKITRAESHTFKDEGGQRTFSCINHNAFLNMNPNAISGKTGFTCDAGYCYVGAANSDGHTYIWSLLGCGWPGNKTYKWKDSKTLLNYGEENTAYVQLKTSPSPSVNINFSSVSANPKMVNTCCSLNGITALSIETSSDTPENSIKYQYSLPDNVKAPVYKGEVLGTVYVYRDGKIIDAASVYAADDIKNIELIDEIIMVICRALM